MSFVLHIDAPGVTVEEYARRTGMPVGTVRDKVATGELPVIKTSVPGKRERIMVNMVALLRLANDQADSFIDPMKGA